MIRMSVLSHGLSGTAEIVAKHSNTRKFMAGQAPFDENVAARRVVEEAVVTVSSLQARLSASRYVFHSVTKYLQGGVGDTKSNLNYFACQNDLPQPRFERADPIRTVPRA